LAWADADVSLIGIVVEGTTDRFAAQRLLAACDLQVDASRVIVTGGKQRFDARIAKYNEAAKFLPWLALRDADRDADGCPVALRRRLLVGPQSEALCLRLAVRTIDAWLLADRAAFSDYFAVPMSRIPIDPERLDRPKDALTNVCRSTRRRAVRQAMVPPDGSHGPGPEYTANIINYCRAAWRPAQRPRLHRAFGVPSPRSIG
jgi:hypothetical protein